MLPEFRLLAGFVFDLYL